MAKDTCWCCLPRLFSSFCNKGEKDIEMLMQRQCTDHHKNVHQLWSHQGLSYNKVIEQALIEGTFVSNSLNLLRDNEKALFLLGFPIW